MKKALLRAASVRTRVVLIDDGSSGKVDVLVREVGSSEFAHYGMLIKPKDKGGLGAPREESLAYLLSTCIVEETDSGLTPVYTETEAMNIARSARVSMKIADAIMSLSGFSDEGNDKGEPDASRDVRPSAGGPAG